MVFNDFVAQVTAFWKKYFSDVAKQQAAGTLIADGVTLFPNMIIFTHCEGFYLCELVGATEQYKGLKIKFHRDGSVYRYLDQFDGRVINPLISMSGRTFFKGLILANSRTNSAIASRFPFIQMHGTQLQLDKSDGCVFEFKDNFQCCFVEDCVLVNSRENLHRCKNILSLLVCKSNVSKANVDLYFREYFWEGNEDLYVRGVHTVASERAKKLVVISQFQSVYLQSGLRETTIGEFVRLHPEIVHDAFNTKRFLHEPSMRWIEHDGTCLDDSINPDLLVQREDGRFDIYDLKTALLNKKNLTKGGRRRRRFIDGVAEGVAQLANYREYFTYPKNAAHAKEKYGVEILSPRLVLVVGSWENADVVEVMQACRQYIDVEIIDYDTVCQMFLGGTVR